MRALVILSLFGLLFVTACGGKVALQVTRTDGTTAGEIEYGDEEQSTIIDANGNKRGRAEGLAIFDTEDKPAGSVKEQNGKVIILDAGQNAVGTLENETDCYGKSQLKLGMISASIDQEAAAAACLLLLLPQE